MGLIEVVMVFLVVLGMVLVLKEVMVLETER